MRTQKYFFRRSNSLIENRLLRETRAEILQYYSMHKKFILLILLFLGVRNYSSAQVSAPEHSQPLTRRESISGIGTNHTIYSTPLTIDSRCRSKMVEFLNADSRIHSHSISDHQVDITWNEDTHENIIFFFEKLEFQYIFPCSN